MLWLIVLLILCIVILLTILFTYRKDIKNISAQIEKSQGQYVNIRMNSLDKSIEDLVIKINKLYDLNQKSTIKIKHKEEELRRSIANMTHDLRTPLTSIMGYLQLIKSENVSGEEREKYFDIIQRRTETLQSLIESFYELSRLNSNEYQFELITVDLSNILCETVALFYHDFTNKNIEPIINIEENLPSIISDEKALTRIFTNLINNMIKHGQDTVIINLRQEKDLIIAEFINSAPDLQEEQVPHIFDRFFTGDRARSDKNTGLGLYIAKTLAEQLGNRMVAQFKDGMLNIRVSFSLNYKIEP
ncbi:Alkaline phosphatase synthesis sensor protein PhoR [Clostridium sp. N3C]|uniref:sensor histidine kinase n=1 Tax=Clostridium sp. N3C TaxID=1776758 RepID=UPI00092E11EA|nr:HAMP domain-containing sensor histidine kinase [Clostridium sp. N3C]SCN22854.1 Alkaline phosphatase synthesis sensor protein PhoR [Clostridium sp. N3C]